MTDDPQTPTPSIYGLVLAGGRSRRFGHDKAAVAIGHQSLLSRTVGVLQAVIENVFVSIRADQIDDRLRRQFQLIIDQDDSLGPASGIFAAHESRPDVAWLVVACDMPLLDSDAVRYLIQARAGRRAATAYCSPDDGLPEPLCAIYEPDTLARFQRQATVGKGLSPRGLLAHADVELVDPPHNGLLSSANTVDDLARLLGTHKMERDGGK
jgi:molybdopterin-guanine dinucleotide biosynthesis protein A